MKRTPQSTAFTVTLAACISALIVLLLSACGGSNQSNHADLPSPAWIEPSPSPTRPLPTEIPRSQVFINGSRVRDEELQTLAAEYNLRITDGRYWYDAYSGGWGYEGGPMEGFIAPGLAMGGRLRVGASGGGTRVYVNGRELHPQDLAFLMQILGSIPRGAYWLDAHGNFGVVNDSRHVNLIAIIQQHNNPAPINSNSPYQGARSNGDSFNFSYGDCSYIEGAFSCNSSP